MPLRASQQDKGQGATEALFKLEPLLQFCTVVEHLRDPQQKKQRVVTCQNQRDALQGLQRIFNFIEEL